MEILDEDARNSLAETMPDWEVDGETLRRTLTFDDFKTAFGFVATVALAAERANHHPDIDIRWNEVTLALSTHSAGGLTQRDVDLAGIIDRLA